MATWVYTRGTSMADLRAQVRSWSREHEVRSPDDVALVVTELVTNSLVHARANTVPVRLELEGDHAVVSVDDASATAPARASAGREDEHGRGLLVLDALCTRWGCTRLPAGKRTWCELR